MRTVAIIALAALAGCAAWESASDETKVHNLRAVYVVAVETMVELGGSGLITAETAQQFESVRVRAAAMLDEAEAAVAAGASFSFADLASSLEAMRSILAIAAKGVE